ncbi:hypothetical protein ACF3NT_10905 [Naumannella halotolerans]|uniref:hypothetical protein n=1 Tax=Naumannella halotolerans TaxID=993414 RepID=UPI00370D86DE
MARSIATPYPSVITEPPRPGLLTAAAVATMVGSLLWLCGFSLLWLLLYSAMQAVAGTEGFSGTYHLLYPFHRNLLDGGVVPAYLLPSVALVLGGLLLMRAAWVRLAATAWGAVAIGWGALWQSGQPALWAPAAAYIGIVVLVLWTPEVGRWYRWQAESAGAGLAQTPGQARMGP